MNFTMRLRALAAEMGLELTQDISVLRAIVTVERGKSMFQLHAVFSTQKSGGSAQNNRQRSSQKS